MSIHDVRRSSLFVYNRCMILLLFYAFVSGILTILAPCIWPILPVVLSASVTGGRQRPIGVVVGILISFGFLTLALSSIVKVIPLNPDILRLSAVILIALMGLSLLLSRLQFIIEGWVSRLSRLISPSFLQGKSGFRGGFFVGCALGVVWAPCAGPILATIAAVSATREVSAQIIAVTVAFLFGLGIPLSLFAIFGSSLLKKNRAFSRYTHRIQQVFGVVMIITAILIATHADVTLQLQLLSVFPGYNNFVSQFEKSSGVTDALKNIQNSTNKMTGQSYEEPELTGISRWLNTNRSLTLKELRGRVVLVDFWTYTCINCIRTLPYVTGWYEKYKDQGFVVIGVHTPEFEFEKKTENVQDAIERFGIHYPVAQDNDYATWKAFDNHYWPAKYVIDSSGNVRFTHFGEGEYNKTEDLIQQLLKEAGKKPSTAQLSIPSSSPSNVMTPETYIGSNRYEPSDYLSLSEDWNIQSEYAESKSNSTITLTFIAQKAFLVMNPVSNARVRVILDGTVVDPQRAGKDVKDGYVQFDAQRLYELINLTEGSGKHELRLEFETPGVRVFAFTFG